MSRSCLVVYSAFTAERIAWHRKLRWLARGSHSPCDFTYLLGIQPKCDPTYLKTIIPLQLVTAPSLSDAATLLDPVDPAARRRIYYQCCFSLSHLYLASRFRPRPAYGGRAEYEVSLLNNLKLTANYCVPLPNSLPIHLTASTCSVPFYLPLTGNTPGLGLKGTSGEYNTSRLREVTIARLAANSRWIHSSHPIPSYPIGSSQRFPGQRTSSSNSQQQRDDE